MARMYPEPEFVSDWIDRESSRAVEDAAVKRRALSLWPGLDRRKLGRTHGDPKRIARLVAPRSGLLPDEIVELLIGDGHEA